jgi:hypothetical protein
MGLISNRQPSHWLLCGEHMSLFPLSQDMALLMMRAHPTEPSWAGPK